MSKFKISTDRVIGLTAMLVGLLTLIIFIYQTNIMREQSRLEVKPRLSFRFSSEEVNGEVQLSLKLINKGIGPAIIESALIGEVNSDTFESFEDFLKEEHPQILELGDMRQTATLSRGDVISPNEAFMFYTFVTNYENFEKLKEYLGLVDQVTYPWTTTVIYASMYDERWKVTDKLRGHPISIDD